MTDATTPVQTPDRRYIVVRGRLWRCANPLLSAEERARLVSQLMDARRSIGRMKRAGTGDLASARSEVDRAKIALGERGPVWWTDGTPDFSRHLVQNTPYAEWYGASEAENKS